MSFWTAVAALRDSGIFRDTSVRLLADVVELASRDVQRVPPNATRTIADAVFVVMLDGSATSPDLRFARPRKGAGRPRGAPRRTRVAEETIFWNAREVIDVIEETGSTMIELTGGGPMGALVLPLTTELLRRAAAGSPEFVRSVRWRARVSRRPKTLCEVVGVEEPRFERIWLVEFPGVGAPMEALAQLLAQAAPQDCASPARTQGSGVVVTGAGQVTLQLYDADTATLVTARRWDQEANDVVDDQALDAAIEALAKKTPGMKPRGFDRLIFVRPREPAVLPPALRGMRFHRIVALTRGLPANGVRPELAQRLVDSTVNTEDPGNPYFCSFIPSIIIDAPASERPRSSLPAMATMLGALLGVPSGRRAPFVTEPVEEDANLTAEGLDAGPRSRLRRDLCRLTFDLGVLEELWRQRRNGRVFLDLVRAARPRYLETAGRWARAVTNRQVGVALSGGGAASFRAVPLLRFLRARRVPVDVLGASSGGALLGAYYCRYGVAGLAGYPRRGWVALLSGALAGLSSKLVERALDWEFRDTRIEDLEVRLVPLTTALPVGGAPEARAVVRGTLGAAVRASGSLPMVFSRNIRRGTVYTDGATATPLPARALQRFGADLVFGVNCIAAPDQRNPLSDLPGGEYVYLLPFLGPLIDLVVTNGFLLAQISRNAAVDAAVFVEPTPSRAALLEILYWGQGARIVSSSRRDPRIRTGADACLQRWRTFRL